MTGGEGVRVSASTIERAHHKKGANGQTQKGLHSEGRIHIYTRVPFHVFYKSYLARLLWAEAPEKPFVGTRTCTVQALFASTLPTHNLTGERKTEREEGIRAGEGC